MKPLRMSMGDPCALRAYYKLLESESERDFMNVKFRVGKALEPVVVQLLADNGLDVFFALDQQLEIAHDDPWRIGHPDGIVAISQTQRISRWLAERLPPDAILRLFQRETAVLEVKTLNAENFRTFKRRGYDLSNSLLRTYYAQIQAYVNTLAEPRYDELWESEDYREFVKSYARPTWALIVAFAKGTDEIAMHVVERDEEFFARMNDRLERELIAPMYAGLIPAPTYDGSAEECYWCDVREKCPAAKGVAEDLRSLDDVPLDLGAPSKPPSDSRVAALAAEYQELSAQLELLEAEREALRAELLKLVPEGQSVALGNGFVVKHKVIERRGGVDMGVLNAIAQAHGFEIPRTAPTSYSRLSIEPEREDS